jgi:Predicted metal-dependent hydrolase with the TIM-barrel fold
MRQLFFVLTIFSFIACSQKPTADLLVFNATIYTVDSTFTITEAMVIKDGKILATGKKNELIKSYTINDSLDAGGKFIYPGFIDAHAHFSGYGNSLQRVNLVDTKSWEEVLERTKKFGAENPEAWLLGRGWDQNAWPV